jgi:ABC-type uncharacterized transport system substrate-binding protein
MNNLLWVLCLILLIGVAPVFAHPHVFVDSKIKVVFNEKGLAGIHNRWVFDDLYSTAMASSGDADGDGKISATENDWFYKTIMAPNQEKNYFNYVLLGSKFVKISRLDNFKASLRGSRLVLEFDAKFEIPVTADYTMFVVVVADPTNYIQMTTDMENADVDAPDELDVDFFDDGLDGLVLFRSFVFAPQGLFLRFKKK